MFSYGLLAPKIRLKAKQEEWFKLTSVLCCLLEQLLVGFKRLLTAIVFSFLQTQKLFQAAKTVLDLFDLPLILFLVDKRFMLFLFHTWPNPCTSVLFNSYLYWSKAYSPMSFFICIPTLNKLLLTSIKLNSQLSYLALY